MALIHEPAHPSTRELVEMLYFGQTMKERDKERSKQHILNFHKNGVSAKVIAKSLKLDLKFVKSIIDENQTNKED